jgi:type III pantothenate kinase
MRSGVVLGYHALVEGLIKKIGQEVGGFKAVVATGGLGRLFCEKTDLIQHYDEFLILKGLYLISRLSHER